MPDTSYAPATVAAPQRRAGRGRRVGAAVPVGDLVAPRGWFAVAVSAELHREQVLRRIVAGEELAVWRTAGGTAAVATAWCPHLGAHLGCTGRVRGEQLECGFHGFRFSPEGACTGTGYGGRAPARAALATWRTRETGGVVFIWYDPAGEPPTFDLPEIDLDGWTAPSWRTTTFAGHPIETTENSVDIGHLGFLHGYDDVRELEPARAEGACLRARYQMTRGGRSSGLRLPTMRTEFDVSVHGLGCSLVDLEVLTLGARQRLYVLPTPLGGGMVTLRLGVATSLTPLEAAPGLTRRLPASLVARALRELTLLGLYFDVAQDRRIWVTKRHVRHPVLAEGDGPIGLYRRWASQFMAGSTTLTSEPTGS
jgi:nitrite reductase/ring-hydroxylating ferredoxin subunit